MMMLDEANGNSEHTEGNRWRSDPLVTVVTAFDQYDGLGLDERTQHEIGTKFPQGVAFLPLFRRKTPSVAGERKVEQHIPPGLFPADVIRRIKGMELYSSTRFVMDATQYLQLRSNIETSQGTSGGFGVVVEAYDTVQHKSVLIKFLNIPKIAKDPQHFDNLITFINSFIQEMRVTKKLSEKVRDASPLCHIPQVYDGGGIEVALSDTHSATMPFMVMEKIGGTSLKQASLSNTELMQVVSDISITLDVMHNILPQGTEIIGVIHHDVKPRNIQVDENGRGVLLDFGSALGAYRTDEQEPLDLRWGIGFSPAYAAPEEEDSHAGITKFTDQHALAMTVYERLVGSLKEAWSGDGLFLGEPIEENKYWQHTQESQVLAKKDLPEHVYAVLVIATSYNPLARYPSCQAFTVALKEAMLEDGLLAPVVQKELPDADTDETQTRSST